VSTTRRRPALARLLAGAFTLTSITASCQRSRPPADVGVIPLDPVGLARLRRAAAAPVDGGSLERPPAAMSVLFAPASPLANLEPLAAVLEHRATLLGARAVSSRVTPSHVALSIHVPTGVLRSLLLDTLARRGLLELASLDPRCNPYVGTVLPPGVFRASERLGGRGARYEFLYALPVHATGIAPSAPLRGFLADHPPPPARVMLVGTVRDSSGDIARRTYCVSTERAVFGPSIARADATLDPRTLGPMLRLRVHDTDLARVGALFDGAPEHVVIVSMDGDVIGPGTSSEGPGGPWLDVRPQSSMASISPEVVATLLQSGPLPVPVTVVRGPSPE